MGVEGGGMADLVFKCISEMEIDNRMKLYPNCSLHRKKFNSLIMSGDEGKAPEGGSEPITIRVRDQTGEKTFFKIKKTTKMSKVFNTYAQRKGVQLSSLRFLLDGERIEENATPKQLELDDQDQIDCMLEQSGGW